MKRKLKKPNKIKDISKRIQEIEKQIDYSERREHFVFDNIGRISSNLIKIREHIYNFKIQDLDVMINIVLNLLSFSFVMFATFISIPDLNKNLIVSLISLIINALLLILLMWLRRKHSDKLVSNIVSLLQKDIGRLMDRTSKELDLGEKEIKEFKTSLSKVKEELGIH